MKGVTKTLAAAPTRSVMQKDSRANSSSSNPASGTIARMTEIVFTLGRFGFGALIKRRDGNAVRFREALESLGPSFVKLGQLLSLHADEIPESYREELRRLFDRTLPLPIAVIEGVLAKELGEQLSQFAVIEPDPLASASIGQVHRGVLTTGDEVVVKVQRPGAREHFERDLRLLRRLTRVAQVHRLFGLSRELLDDVLSEVEEFTLRELDYLQEAEAQQRFATLEIDGAYTPRVYTELSTHRVLTSEFIDGVTLNEILDHLGDRAWLERHRVDRDDLARRIVHNQLIQALGYGFFQADPHPANLILMPDGRLGYIDFGIVGELDGQMRHDIVDLVLYELLGAYERLWPILFHYSQPTRRTDIAAFKLDFRALSESYKRRADASFGGRSLGTYVEAQLKLYHVYHLNTRGRWATYLRSVVVYGNTVAALSEHFDFMRDTIPIYWRLKARQLLRQGGRNWTQEILRQLFDLSDGMRSVLEVARRAEAGELALAESPRRERARTLRLQAGIATTLGALAAWIAVTLRGIPVAGSVTWPMIAGPLAALCLLRVATLLRRLG
jgi:ubiquinone biosynthesis protein